MAMKLSPNWRIILRKSWSVRLAGIATGCALAITTIREAGPDVLPPELAAFVILWLKRIALVCVIAVIPARVMHQPALEEPPQK